MPMPREELGEILYLVLFCSLIIYLTYQEKLEKIEASVLILTNRLEGLSGELYELKNSALRKMSPKYFMLG